MAVKAWSIDDLQAAFQARVPKIFVDYVEGGSWSEQTLRDNREAFEKWRFRQRVGIDVRERSLATTMLGEAAAMPVALAPVGLAGMQYPNGEVLAAQAAEALGVPFTLSTMSIASIEDVARSVTRPFWFQLYVMRDRSFLRDLLRRAAAAGVTTLMITLDLPIMARRYRDARNGLSVPVEFGLNTLLNIMARPQWAMRMLAVRKYTFGNIQGVLDAPDGMKSLSEWTAEQHDPSLDWNAIKTIRDSWKGKVILKGLLDEEDAAKAVDVGADAIIVSNHGGRQLDGAPSSLSALGGIATEVGDKLEVYLDGGVRSGQDVVKALALGARGVFIGRSYVYGLGADGRRGVEQALGIIREEMDMTMAFCGCRDIAGIGPDILRPAGYSTVFRPVQAAPVAAASTSRAG